MLPLSHLAPYHILCRVTHVMKPIMSFLPNKLHEGLRRFAYEHRTSMTELIRRAVQAT